MKYLPYWILSLTAIVLDQLSKYIVLVNFAEYERLNVIPHFFDLTLVYNPGAAFSFLADMGGAQKYIFTVLAFVISGWLARGMVKGEFGRMGNWAAAMIIGGAFGNVVDRFIHGKVVDFLLFYWQNWYYPAFNVADSFICVGAALMIIESFTQGKKKQQAA
ncbi:MAG: signal peptidase II [Conchiformibius sp.]|nr:signal peptidase II [Conchiformibius sp.]